MCTIIGTLKIKSSSLLFVLSLLLVTFLAGRGEVLTYGNTLYTPATDDDTEWWLGQFVSMTTSCSGGRGGRPSAQAHANVVFNPAIHHSYKPFIDFRRRYGHGSTIFGDMIWPILESSFKLTLYPPPKQSPNKTKFFWEGGRKVG